MKAFMAAGLQAELIKLLEMIVLQACFHSLPDSIVLKLCTERSSPGSLRHFDHAME